MKSARYLMVIVTLLLGACSTAPERPSHIQGDGYDYARAHMRWMIKEKMAERKIVGLSIAIVDDQEIVWAEGFGFADKKKRIKAGPDTIYRAGSITKLFTATAAMQLVEAGLMDIDQPLQTYLPEFRINSRFPDSGPITPRLLMTHHSGLPSDRHNQMWGDETAKFTDLVDVLRDEYVASAPNTIEAYSNVGFSLLGHAVEKVSGLPYAAYIENEILQPAGMAHSYMAANLRDDSRSSKGYSKGKSVPTPNLRDLPAGALNTSVVDLARFAQMTFANGQYRDVRVVEPGTLTEMQRFQDGDGTFDLHQEVGLAWRLDRRFGDDAGIVAGHNGGTMMFFSQFLTLPEHKLAVIVLTNSSSAQGVIEEIGNEALALALESKTGIKQQPAVKLESKLPTLAEDLERLPGAWTTPMGIAHIYQRGDRLKFEVGGTKLDLLRREDGYYHLQYKLLGLIPINMGKMGEAGIGFRRIAGRDLLALYVDSKPVMVVAEKLDEQSLSSAWRAHLGKYEVTNAIGNIQLHSVELSNDDGILTARLNVDIKPGGKEVITEALHVVSNTEATIAGLGRSKGDTIRITESNGEKILSFSGFLLRQVSEGG